MISVIVPVYNAEKNLTQCVDSILAQTYTDLEVLLIDDGSTDSSGSICDEFACKDKRVLAIHKPNGGASDTRNVGFAQFRGDYVTCIDADDLIHPNALETQLRVMEESQADIVISGYRSFADAKTLSVVSPSSQVCTPKEAIALFLQSVSYMNPLWNKLFRRKLLAGFQSKSYASANDMAVSYQAVHRAQRIVLIPDILYSYRIHCNSTVNGPFKLSRMDSMNSLDDMAVDIRAWYPEMENLLLAHETSFAFTLLKQMVVSPAKHPKQEHMLLERIRRNQKPLQAAGLITRSMRRTYATLRLGRPFFKACVLWKNRFEAAKIKRLPQDLSLQNIAAK